ncbi:MAG: ArnT family glycosyltransferase [Candidatus Brocadiia bacterium]
MNPLVWFRKWRVRQPLRWLFLIWAIGFAVRCISIAGYPPALPYGTKVYWDEVDYDMFACNLLRSGSFHSCPAGFIGQAHRPPGYPAFLAGVYSLLGRNVTTVRLIQALLSSFNILLIYLIVRKVGFAPRLGLLVAGFMALHAPNIALIHFHHDPVLSTVLLNSFLLFLAWLPSSPIRSAIVGITGGLCALIRPSFLASIIAAVIPIANGGKWHGKIRRACLFALPTLFVVTPWIVRSSRLVGKPVLITTAPAWHFYVFGTGDPNLRAKPVQDALFQSGIPTERKMYAEGLKRARKEFSKRPFTALASGIWRLVKWFEVSRWPSRFYKPRAYVAFVGNKPLRFPLLDFEGLIYVTMAVTAFWGIFRKQLPGMPARWWTRWKVLFWPVAAYTAAHLVASPLVHHRLIIAPILIAIMITWISALILGEDSFKKPEPPPDKKSIFRGILIVFLVATGLTALVLVRSARFEPLPRPDSNPSSGISYDDVRLWQARDKGSLAQWKDTEIDWAGIAHYPAEGWRTEPGIELGDIPCSREENWWSAWLMIRDSKLNRFGEGLIRITGALKNSAPPQAGQPVRIRGQLVGTSCFATPIVEVTSVEQSRQE